MFIIRQAQPTDLDDLHALAKQTFFINLPPDREIISSKIEQSRRSFAALARASGGGRGRTTAKSAGAGRHHSAHHTSGLKAVTGRSDLFLLVLEDLDGRGVVGTSQVIARMGGPGHPRVYLGLDTMTRQSASLKISWTHQIARVGVDESGPSEIGGLILNHAFRGHKLRLGRFLSFARFHLIGLFRKQFASKVVAEMLGPIDKTGYNPFFEHFTRHYIPRSFAEVYRFSQTSKEFVTGLLPPGDIDLSILDPEVANSAGEVGPETQPARKMLERLGFRYLARIDPLDGGPHLEARTDSISLVQATRAIDGVVAGAVVKGRGKTGRGGDGLIVSTLDGEGHFRAVSTGGSVEGRRVRVPSDAARALAGDGIVARGVTVVGE